MKNPVFVTGNPAKAEQLSRHLGIHLERHSIDLPEIQSLSLSEIVAQKAKAAYEILGTPVLVEDTALTFPALGKLPGPLIKWFLHELGTEGLCHLLDGYEKRDAVATTMFGLYDGTKLHTFSGEMEGSISPSAVGKQGFGWDPVFIPNGHTKTWAEMSLEEQAATSIRKIALTKLESFLKQDMTNA